MSPTPSLGQKARWQAFRMIERAGELRSPAARADLSVVPEGHSNALWVFVATFGELAMIEPFLRRLVAEFGPHPLVLISDRQIYRSAYAQRYPEAIVVEIPGASEDYRELARRIPPKLFVVAEIPALPSDAPCRLPVGALHHAATAGARIALVNAWLYNYPPSCRIDTIERQLLSRDYLQLYDVITTHNEDVRAKLIAQGAAPELVTATGNFKFDSVAQITNPSRKPMSPLLLKSLLRSPRPTVIAGSLERREQARVLDSFELLRKTRPDARLILVPRHPENTQRMEELASILNERGWNWTTRTRMPDEPLPASIDCLILDTFGELRDFYSVATIAHVGRDHNVLEPLAFKRPVSVSADWNTTCPSFPVYRTALEAGVIHECTDSDSLLEIWLTLLDGQGGSREREKIQLMLEQVCGATERTLTLFRKHGLLPQQSQSGSRQKVANG